MDPWLEGLKERAQAILQTTSKLSSPERVKGSTLRGLGASEPSMGVRFGVD